MDTEQNKIEQENTGIQEISLKDLIFKFKEWFNYFRSKWKLLFIACVLGGATGFAIAFFSKPIYIAKLTFAMEEDKGGIGGGGLSGALGLASSFGFDLGGGGGGGAFAASNLAELMKSRLIVEKVLLDTFLIDGKNSTLAEYYIQINELRKNWEKHPNLKKIHFQPNPDRSKFNLQQDSILQGIYNSLTGKETLSITQKDKKVSILSIEVKSKNELFSKSFCENLANETSDFYIKTKSKKARLNTNVLQKQVDSVRLALNNSITGVAQEADNLYNLNPTLNIKGAGSKKIQVDVTANTEILKQLVVQLELSKITLRKETPLIQVIDRPIFPLEKEKAGKKKYLLVGSFFACFMATLYLYLTEIYKKIVGK
jgi:uncharacterized protein involved in exopolysaccharide biosynthesis